MRPVAAALAVSLLFGCRAHDPYSKVNELADGDRCEDALAEMSSRQGRDPGALARAQQAGGTVSSYALTAAGYTSDVVIYFVGGLALGVVVCSPVLVIEAAANSKGNASGECIARVGFDTMREVDPGVGKHVYAETAAWRQDLDYTPLSRAMRKVAGCHERRGDAASLTKAYVQLRQIVDSGLYANATDGEREEVDQAFARVELKLKDKDPAIVKRTQAQYEEARGVLSGADQAKLWRESPDGPVWRFVATEVKDADQAREVCANTPSPEGPWRLPNAAEVRKARAAGLLDPVRNRAFTAAIDARSKAWVDEGGEPRLLGFDTRLVEPSAVQGETAQLLCVR